MSGLAIITIDNKEWQVTLATAPREMSQGLGGLMEILPGIGMLFDTGFEQTIEVTTVDNPEGSTLSIQRIDGSVTIVGSDGHVPGDCDGDGMILVADAMCALKM